MSGFTSYHTKAKSDRKRSQNTRKPGEGGEGGEGGVRGKTIRDNYVGDVLDKRLIPLSVVYAAIKQDSTNGTADTIQTSSSSPELRMKHEDLTACIWTATQENSATLECLLTRLELYIRDVKSMVDEVAATKLTLINHVNRLQKQTASETNDIKRDLRDLRALLSLRPDHGTSPQVCEGEGEGEEDEGEEDEGEGGEGEEDEGEGQNFHRLPHALH